MDTHFGKDCGLLCNTLPCSMMQFVCPPALMQFVCPPASVAQLDAHPTEDQEVGFYPCQAGNILSWRFVVKYFLQSFSPFADTRRAVVSFWRKNVHNTS